MTKKEIRHYVVCNLSYAATSALIETKLYSKVITNMVEWLYSRQRPTFEFEKIFKRIDSSKTLGRFIWIAFDWYNTPEGYKYWDNIFNQYHIYAIRF